MVDVLFINSTDNLALKSEANGTMLLATLLLQSGIQAKILRFAQFEYFNKNYSAFIKGITEKIISISPKCISFCALWPYYHMMLRIAREVKTINPNIVVAFGGPQASFTAKATMEAMDYVDYICTGEGENTVVPFFRSVLNNDIKGIQSVPGLYYRSNDTVCFNSEEIPLCDLNALPYWDDHLWADDYSESKEELASKTYYMPIDAGRGCPFRCTFCCTSSFLHRTYRLKSAQKIVEQIKYYKNKFGIRSFAFSHDALTANKKLVSEICDRIIEEDLDIVWKCTSRIDCVDEELILKMKSSGLRYIEFGVETGSPEMQKKINKRLNLDKIVDTVSFLKNNNIGVSLFFMCGFPDETEDDLSQTLELLFKLVDMGVNDVSMGFCQFMPSTIITEKHFDELILDPDIKVFLRGLSAGYNEELQMIKENKSIFPFFYHLNTPVRDKYQYLELLIYIYQEYPISAKHLRSLYNGDNLKFYRDFYESNIEIFKKDATQIEHAIYNSSLEMLYNTMTSFDAPFIKQLKALMKFEKDTRRISKSHEDISFQETYDFSYIDFQLKLPIEKYSDGKTELLLQKNDGAMKMKVLHIT